MTLHHLRGTTLCYLLLPVLLFLVFWVKPLYAVPSVAVLAGLTIYGIQEEPTTGRSSRIWSGWSLAGAAIAAVFLVVCEGVGGYTCQVADYWIHNAKMKDLIGRSWPLQFPNGAYVCYYFGYFLPVAGLARWLGNEHLLTVLWASLGLWLTLLWLYTLLGGKSWGWVVLVVFFGTPYNLYSLLQLVWNFYESGRFNGFMLDSIAPYSDYIYVYFPFLRSLQWVPNQVLPTALATTFFFYETIINRRFAGPVLAIALLFYWAPFPALFLALIAGLTFMQQTTFWLWISQLRSIGFLLLLIGGMMPLLLYFLCSGGTLVSGFLWKFDPHWLRTYVLNVVGEALIPLLLLYKADLPSQTRKLLLPLMIVFLLLPLYRIGVYNDLNGRGTIPPLFLMSILFACVLQKVLQAPPTSRLRIAALTYYIAGAVLPVVLIVRGVGNNSWRTGCSPCVDEQLTDLRQVLMVKNSLAEARQYECKGNCFFTEQLLRQPD